MLHSARPGQALSALSVQLQICSDAAGHLKGVKGIFGMHVWPMSPSGTINTRPGQACSAAPSHVLVLVHICFLHATCLPTPGQLPSVV